MIQTLDPRVKIHTGSFFFQICRTETVLSSPHWNPMNPVHRSFKKTPPTQTCTKSLHPHMATNYDLQPNMIGTFSEKENFGFHDFVNPDVSFLTLQPRKPEMLTKVDSFNETSTCHLFPTSSLGLE